MNKNLLILFWITVLTSICAGYACYYEYTHTWIATPFPEFYDFARQIVSDIFLAINISVAILVYRQHKYKTF